MVGNIWLLGWSYLMWFQADKPQFKLYKLLVNANLHSAATFDKLYRLDIVHENTKNLKRINEVEDTWFNDCDDIIKGYRKESRLIEWAINPLCSSMKDLKATDVYVAILLRRQTNDKSIIGGNFGLRDAAILKVSTY